MKREGPVLETLTRRLAETPPDFLDEPLIGSKGRVHVGAVVFDLLAALGATLSQELLAQVERIDAGQDHNTLGVTLVLCWLLADPWFREHPAASEEILQLLTDGAASMAPYMTPRKMVSDPDRREEAVRCSLACLGLRPAGESKAQAEDRLTGLSSAERSRVLAASRKAEERARAIREALARKAAEESADKWTRE